MENRRLDPLVTCFVPSCKNAVITCPGKHFFHVPKQTRVEWCAAVNKPNVPKSSIYICEDHINIKEDILNYQDWKDNKVIRPRLKPEVPKTLRNVNSTLSIVDNDDSFASTSQHVDKWVLTKPTVYNKTVQVCPVMVHRSVGVNILKKRTCDAMEGDVSEENYTPEEDEPPSTVGSTSEFTETESSSVPVFQLLVGRDFMLNLIKNKPYEFLGITKQSYWIIDYIENQTKTKSLYIILTLYRIKNNDTFTRMSDIFQVSLATLWRIFYSTLKLLRLFFSQFIYWPTTVNIKQNLPSIFRCKAEYARVQSIIDAFEIEVEKPRKPIEQSLSWSQYKQCNTIKYLIGATPDGFISFISEGYGGRVSDMYLIEQSGFFEVVPENVTILADRGFKHLESHLLQKSVKVLRPPTVNKDKKMTKSEVMDTKVIASLRVHIERVIRRIRLFKLLKPHSVVNNKLINVLDDAVIVACGLINLQSPILRKV